MNAPTLFRPPPPVPARLTPDQQTAWELITTTPGGVYAYEIGRMVHGHEYEGGAIFCDWCGARGQQLVRSKALAPLVIKRRTGRIEARDPSQRTQPPSAQGGEIPW